MAEKVDMVAEQTSAGVESNYHSRDEEVRVDTNFLIVIFHYMRRYVPT